MKSSLASRIQTLPGLSPIRDAGPSTWPPLALLLIALATVFIFANDRDAFYRSGHHTNVTYNHMTIAANLSPEHRFLGFYFRSLEPDGSINYHAYNRFPIGGYLLIKLFIFPFPNDLSAQLYSARILMLLAYAGAAVLAYLSLCRLTNQPWIALTATLLAFASAYWLYYNDMVATEIGLDFFGVMLVFHAMTLFIQEGRFRQLLLKSCLALLLGWHIYALLLPFILMGLVSELIRGRGTTSPSPSWPRIRAALAGLFRNRFLTLGVVTLLFGTALLGANLANEYFNYRGENFLTELPSVDSMNRRLSFSQSDIRVFSSQYTGQDLLLEQFYRIGGMSIPYALPPGHISDLGPSVADNLAGPGIILGLAVTAVALLGLAFVHHKLLWATLSLCGFGWMLIASGNVYEHDYESLFYTGIPLAACSYLLLYLSRPGGRRFIAAGSAAALLLFGLSAFQMAQVGHDATAAQKSKQVLADLSAIHSLTQDSTVANFRSVPEVIMPMLYYLNRVIGTQTDRADFLIFPLRLEGVDTLTPQNSQLFLYPGGPEAFQNYLGQILAQAGPPLIKADYAVYHYAGQPDVTGDWLFYVKTPCQPQDLRARIFLHVVPQDPDDLPLERWQYGFANLDFNGEIYPWSGRKICVAGRPLPSWPVDRIRTGQFQSPDGHPLWQGEAVIPPDRGRGRSQPGPTRRP